jgi:hypothetical protein
MTGRWGVFPVSFLLLSLCAWGGTADLASSPAVISAFQGEAVPLSITLSNHSPFPIGSEKNYFISFHLYTPDRALFSFDNRRFPIPRTVRPGASARFSLPVYFACRPGKYLLELDIVKEGEFWGSHKGWKTAWLTLELKALISPEFKAGLLKTWFETGDHLIESEQYLLRLVYRNCEMRRDGRLFGFAAGSDYPQIWIRDLATFVSGAKLYYPLADLQRMAERFLEHQRPAGDIVDWVDGDGRSDKNTVETDQESSLVLAAYEIALDDPGWLRRIVAGEPVFARLRRALQWVWDRKRNNQTGLVTSGLTADWGDVENTYPDQRAIKWSDRSTPVHSIYTQAKFIQAIDRLIDMAHALGEEVDSRNWAKRLTFLRQKCRQQLYLKNAGYFRIHLIPGEPARFDFEKDILAVGGNAEAIRAGLMTPQEISAFLAVLEKRRSALRLGSVSFTLLPPYPDRFFPHPLLSSSWSYQNGGEWDWIGGRVIDALFQSGHREKAQVYLKEIIGKHLRNFNIFEWEDRSGAGRGASFYVGAAGAIGRAIWEGYLGFGQDFGRYRIRPAGFSFRLGVDKTADRFSVVFDGVPVIRIEELRGKTVCLYRHPKETPFCAAGKGETVVR